MILAIYTTRYDRWALSISSLAHLPNRAPSALSPFAKEMPCLFVRSTRRRLLPRPGNSLPIRSVHARTRYPPGAGLYSILFLIASRMSFICLESFFFFVVVALFLSLSLVDNLSASFLKTASRLRERSGNPYSSVSFPAGPVDGWQAAFGKFYSVCILFYCVGLCTFFLSFSHHLNLLFFLLPRRLFCSLLLLSRFLFSPHPFLSLSLSQSYSKSSAISTFFTNTRLAWFPPSPFQLPLTHRDR